MKNNPKGLGVMKEKIYEDFFISKCPHDVNVCLTRAIWHVGEI